jgi:hypothetical protein
MIEGFRENFSIFSDAEYRRPAPGDFARDAANLRSDGARVTADLERNTRRAEKKAKDAQ